MLMLVQDFRAMRNPDFFKLAVGLWTPQIFRPVSQLDTPCFTTTGKLLAGGPYKTASSGHPLLTLLFFSSKDELCTITVENASKEAIILAQAIKIYL